MTDTAQLRYSKVAIAFHWAIALMIIGFDRLLGF